MNIESQIAKNLGQQTFKGGRTGRLAKEMATVASTVTKEALQDHATLKQNTLILSSLIVSLSRVFQSNKSAIKARGTEDGPFRYREAIKTSIREMGGWTFSFLVFRAFQNLAKSAFRKMTGAEKHPSLIRNAKNDIKLSLKNFASPDKAQNLKPIELKRNFSLHFKPEALPKMERFYNRFKIDSIYKFFKQPEAITLAEKTTRLNGIYKLLPIGIGMIPAVYLSGFFLENFTQKHSQSVVEFISKKFNPASSAMTNNNPSSPSSFSGNANGNKLNTVSEVSRDFSSFMKTVR